MTPTLKHKMLSGTAWQFAERMGGNLLQLVCTIIIARLLTPTEYGIVALLTIVINLCATFIEGGFRNAIVQKKEITEDDLSSVFWLNLSISLLLYVLVYFTAPWIADFYDNAELAAPLRVLTLLNIVNSVAIIPNALIIRDMKFGVSFKIRMVAQLASSAVAIGMAFMNFGYWALIVQQLLGGALTTVMLLFAIRWYPRLIMNFAAIGELFKFGGYLLLGSFLNVLYSELYTLVIGKLFSPRVLGYYNRGQNYAKLIGETIITQMAAVVFPAFSELQKNPAQLRSAFRKSLLCTLFFTLPALVLLAVVAEPVVIITLSEKWRGAIVFLQISAVTYLFMPIHMFNIQVIRAMGRSDITLVLEIIKKVQLLAIIFITYRWGVVAMCAGGAFSAFLSTLWNAHPTRRMLGCGWLDQLFLTRSLWLTNIAAAALAWGAQYGIHNQWGKLLAAGSVFGVAYLGLHWIFRTQALREIMIIAVDIMKRRMIFPAGTVWIEKNLIPASESGHAGGNRL